jgi:hypothetical protein
MMIVFSCFIAFLFYSFLSLKRRNPQTLHAGQEKLTDINFWAQKIWRGDARFRDFAVITKKEQRK